MKIKNCFSSRYGKLKKSWHHTGQVYPVHRFAYSAEPIYQRTIPFFCWILHRNIGIFLQKIKAHNNLFENASKLHLFISNDFINWFFIKQRRNLIVQNNNGFFVAKNMMIIISKISVFVCVCVYWPTDRLSLVFWNMRKSKYYLRTQQTHKGMHKNRVSSTRRSSIELDVKCYYGNVVLRRRMRVDRFVVVCVHYLARYPCSVCWRFPPKSIKNGERE